MSNQRIPEPYSGRKALITGSTHGIGLAIAIRLAEGGADVVLNYRENQSKADSAAAQIKALGRRCIVLKADMSIADDCRRLAKEAVEFLGGLDFLIHNAGPFAMGAVADMSPDIWDYIVAANFSAAYHITQVCIRELRKSDYPCIIYIGGVNTGIIAAKPRMAAYAAAKAALAVLMRTVAVEEGPNGIRANMVCPGYIDTGEYSKNFKKKAVDEIPLRRLGTPDDVAAPVCRLLTREASYITGAIIDAGGGLWV
jgi:NAD(P)-dependent dehydrogenase (short-subunit alcohol dehydrogenase family)